MLSFFPRGVLDEILNLIESVSEGFPSYSTIKDTTSGSQVNSCFPYRLVDRKLVKAPPPPVFFIAGRPKAALLFWFFGDFRCGALLFMVIHVIYKYKNK